MNLDSYIKSQGWSFYGVVPINQVQDALKKHQKTFKEWIKNGNQADMSYLERMEEDRFHPENKLPDVKSIIVLGAIYRQETGNKKQDTAESCGKVAKYAVGRDYHKVLKKKLIKLSEYLKSEIVNLSAGRQGHKSVTETYISVDSGPTVDRVLAETAGLGYFGKNSCLINPKHGSFFFIASLMINVELEPLAISRMPNCGDCTKCLDSCPTGALSSPGVVDARKCISYLTIENKGSIPIEFREKMGNRLFGCDACQDCCPFNQRDVSCTIDDLRSQFGVGDLLSLKDILKIKTDEEFLKQFAGTPIMRTKRIGLLRNACIASGNTKDQSLIPYLKKLIEQESDKMLIEHAEWGINEIEKNK